MHKLITATILILLVSTGCYWRKRPDPPVYTLKKVWGYKPVYSNDSTLLQPKAMGPQPVQFAGKIYVKGNLIFQNDYGYGIHIIDNSDPAAARRIGFIQLRGNSEISIKGNYLYGNSFMDMVVIDVSNWLNPVEVKRIRSAFTSGYNVSSTFIPLPEHKVYYECPYLLAGIHTGWRKDSVWQNSCYNP